MADKRSFSEMKTEQARMTESWKAEGRLSEAWVTHLTTLCTCRSEGTCNHFTDRRSSPFLVPP